MPDEINMQELCLIGMCLSYALNNFNDFYAQQKTISTKLGLPMPSLEHLIKQIEDLNAKLVMHSLSSLLNLENQETNNENHH